jgi:ubiquinone/menaquinone biosynthesis C-methylase UbiE
MGLRMALGGNRVVLIDTSASGLAHAMRRARALRMDAHPLRASVFHLPFGTAAFDGVFNAGVLDHFGPDYRRMALKEMIRVTEKDRRIAVLTNDARSLVHPRAMKYAQRKGTWPHGYKAALRSLRAEAKSADPKCRVKEISRGFISQFEFLRYYLPPESFAVRLFFWLFFVISFPLSFLNYFPGQYLVTIIEKSDEP